MKVVHLTKVTMLRRRNPSSKQRWQLTLCGNVTRLEMTVSGGWFIARGHLPGRCSFFAKSNVSNQRALAESSAVNLRMTFGDCESVRVLTAYVAAQG